MNKEIRGIRDLHIAIDIDGTPMIVTDCLESKATNEKGKRDIFTRHWWGKKYSYRHWKRNKYSLKKRGSGNGK